MSKLDHLKSRATRLPYRKSTGSRDFQTIVLKSKNRVDVIGDIVKLERSSWKCIQNPEKRFLKERFTNWEAVMEREIKL